eukprot:2359938-Pleurochrysis_carterae.AAC.2
MAVPTLLPEISSSFSCCFAYIHYESAPLAGLGRESLSLTFKLTFLAMPVAQLDCISGENVLGIRVEVQV